MITFSDLTDCIGELIKLMNAAPKVRFTVTRGFEDPKWKIFTEQEWVEGGKLNEDNYEHVVLSLNLSEIGRIYEAFGPELKLGKKRASLQKDI